ncbi:MAG: tetratricopeptide repeat protein [Desulfovibrionaceae bacterium]|nr:tetratricopeptide repeat protein [Desulfovibrionaceae bacterium]
MNKCVFSLCLLLPVLFFSPLVYGEDLSWEDLNSSVTGYYQEQKFSKAADFAEQALELARKGKSPEQLATSLNNLAMINTHLGKFGEAEILNKEALGVRQNAFGLNDIRVAGSWNNLGLIYFFVKKMADAEQCFVEALHIYEEHYGKTSQEIIPALEKLGKFYKKTENSHKEEEITERIQALTTGAE